MDEPRDSEEEPEDDDLLAPQEDEGYGEDDGEREESPPE